MNVALTRSIIKSTICKTLVPKFETRVLGSDGIDKNTHNSFEKTIRLLTSYVYENYSKNITLNVSFIQGLHKSLYPDGIKIVVFRNGKYYYNTPGKWRLHDYEPQISTSYWSARLDVEKDLFNFTEIYNSLQNKQREDMLRYYFDFLRVHPFAESNLTTVSIICDLECIRYGFDPLNMLDIRFKDKQFMYYFTAYYEKNIHKENILEEILGLIDNFHTDSLSLRVIEEKNKQVVKSTDDLYSRNTSLTIELSIQKLQPYLEAEGKEFLVRKVMQDVFYPYFLTKSKEVQEKYIGQFEQHMEILSRHSMNEYITPPNGLSIDYIRRIHKNIYGELTNIKIKSSTGVEEYMIPGEFKTKPNGISRLDSPGTFLVCTPPEKVKDELDKLLVFLNEGNDDIFKKVIQFFLTFTEIHPFPDDNGKIGMMLVDIILIKNDIYPFFMASYKTGNERHFYEMLQGYSSGSNKDMLPFYSMVCESYERICRQKGIGTN